MKEQTYPFRLSGLRGEVGVLYGANADPAHWGYDLLGLDYPSALAKGFPVLRADVTYEGDGYAATLGWVQVVWMTAAGKREPRVIVDVAPQLIGTGFPYISFGIDPTMFDAPSTTESDVDWAARTFLTASPDRLMTRIIEPILGLRWGYMLRGGTLEFERSSTRRRWRLAASAVGDCSSFLRVGGARQLDRILKTENAPRTRPGSPFQPRLT